ncbi:hypothetical protein [Actinomyces naeslundii]|uniref:hypothetical protein n=1 Tax=Actinomyces naeslundii TaxID=1655 RepID=UPI0011777D28|nr:hypothetical protein [Actinomyces naeslundii]
MENSSTKETINTITKKTNDVLQSYGYQGINGGTETMLAVSASIKAHQDTKVKVVFATLGIISIASAWILSGGGFNVQYLALLVAAIGLESTYLYFTRTDMGSRDAASSILNARSQHSVNTQE